MTFNRCLACWDFKWGGTWADSILTIASDVSDAIIAQISTPHVCLWQYMLQTNWKSCGVQTQDTFGVVIQNIKPSTQFRLNPSKKISETCLTSPLLMRIIHRHECLRFFGNTIPSTRGLPKCTVATGLPIDVLKICKSASKRWNDI